MKLTKSKQFLAYAIHASGKGWPDGANWACQSGADAKVYFSTGLERPIKVGRGYRVDGGGMFLFDEAIECAKLSPNWHQTVLSREEYFSAYPAGPVAVLKQEPVADAYGWIEWNGGDQPVKDGVKVDVKYKASGTNIGVRAGFTGTLNEGSMAWYSAVKWSHTGSRTDIVAYRLHKPERVKISDFNPASDGVTSDTKAFQDAIDSMTKPTIEQLASNYRNANDYADRKQQEAEDAKAAADAALGELELAGEALGLLIGIVRQEPELLINDWRDLLVGDEIYTLSGDVVTVTGFDPDNEEWPVLAVAKSGGDWIVGKNGFTFIRRP